MERLRSINAGLLTCTVTPGSTAPSESFTVPAMMLLVCADATAAQTIRPSHAATQEVHFPRVILRFIRPLSLERARARHQRRRRDRAVGRARAASRCEAGYTRLPADPTARRQPGGRVDLKGRDERIGIGPKEYSISPIRSTNFTPRRGRFRAGCPLWVVF